MGRKFAGVKGQNQKELGLERCVEGGLEFKRELGKKESYC